MWLKVTDTSGNPMMMNFANVVQMQQQSGHTTLWTNVAKGDSWLVFLVTESAEDLLTELNHWFT